MTATLSVFSAAALLLGAQGAPMHDPGNPLRLRAEPAHPGSVAAPLPVPPRFRLEVIDALVDASAPAALTTTALGALRDEVRAQSHPDALRLAFRAYYNFRAAHPEHVRNPYLYFVDFGLDSDTPRGYVFDMETLQVVDGPFTVAHGRGSDRDRDGLPTVFSNVGGSYATSLGLFLTQETYTFHGTAGGDPYRSVGLRLLGLSERFNSAARERRVVAHGAPYVTPEGAGRSEGCPAMEMDRAATLLPRISNGGLVFLFSPLDPTWMREDPWAGGAAERDGPLRG